MKGGCIYSQSRINFLNLNFLHMERFCIKRNRCFFASYRYNKLYEKFHCGTFD